MVATGLVSGQANSDGRAILIFGPYVSQSPCLTHLTLTQHTRLSRGLATCHSPEAMMALLSFPHLFVFRSTWSLAMVYLHKMPAIHEPLGAAYVMTRVVEMFMWIGEMLFFGGRQQHADFEALHILGEWTGNDLVLEVAQSSARIVAMWQDVSILSGLLLASHSNPPNMIIYAYHAMLNTLAPLISTEIALGNKAVCKGWTNNMSDEITTEWHTSGMEAHHLPCPFG
ncbi:hypothetical protein BKA82DRAFT_4009400 [Pisolithus tinctorius]|nr:hypothetical protein BKA82DRAFT_4009400 [Pisolithus tinctorius]